MTDTTQSDDDSIDPQPTDLWVLLNDSDRGSNSARLAIAEVISPIGEPLTSYSEFDPDTKVVDVSVVYDTIDHIETPNRMTVTEDKFYAKLPEADEFDEQYADLLDYMLGLITPKDAADVLDGEPSYQTNGERGYDAADFFVLDGIQDSITEWSVHQGHGPSRYGRSVEGRIDDLPEWLAKRVLRCERERWTGAMEMRSESAAKVVELLLLEDEYLDTDHHDELRELVAEFDLEYDAYREEEC